MLLTNARIATMDGTGDGTGLGMVERGAVLIEGGRIAWAGPAEAAPGGRAGRDLARHDLGGRLVTPAPIDCHTHIVHGGDRAAEFARRLEGVPYEEIARAGGGIVSTMRATRGATLDGLIASALPRLDALIAEGVATIEVKSGYGLDRETELRMLRAARALGAERPVRVVTTFLGAHAVPDGRDADAYIDEVCIPTLEAAQSEGLVDAVDGFCEGIAFTPAQIGRVFDRAAALGLPVKLHAEQLSHTGGTRLAARHGAISADHLERACEADAAAMAEAGTVAVLLPGAAYTLRDRHVPPVGAFRAHGVPMAVATDCNPGSSPLASILLAMNMACTLFRFTPAEALTGVTASAARALGLDDRGVVRPGALADLAVWDVADPAELAYRIGFNPLHARIFGGAMEVRR